MFARSAALLDGDGSQTCESQPKSKEQTTMKNTTSNCSLTLLSIPEVAWILGVDTSRVWRAIRIGLLPVVRRRGRVLVPAHALAHLANSDESRGDAR